MTAIAGLIQLDGAAVAQASIAPMQAILTPYGRDDQAELVRPEGALMRSLLRITPEDRFDQQPLSGGEGSLYVVFDGRLDNRDALAQALGIPAHEALSLADSAFALHACERWGEVAPQHLLGDFALACWQPRQRRLWLARSPLGHRPLVWHRQRGFFAFATFPATLCAVPGVPRALCEARLAADLVGLPLGGLETLYRDIYRVEPGQVLVLAGNQVTTRWFHTFDPRREIILPRDDDYLQAFCEHLERAVACRLRALGPIASHLSSGFDSATVTAVAARQLAARGERLIAYTAAPREGFAGPVPPGRHGDEVAGARALSARFANIEHVILRTDGALLERLPAFAQVMSLTPVVPANLMWTKAIEEDASRRGATVLLDGLLGNLSISYTGGHLLPALLRRGRLGAWWREVRALRRHRPGSRWRRLLAQSFGPLLPLPLWRLIEHYARRQGRRLTAYSPIHPACMIRLHMQTKIRDAGLDLAAHPQATDRRRHITRTDRPDIGDYFVAANAYGLERRDPTGDLRLMEFCLAVPERQFMHQGQDRWLLRRAMREVLPAEILTATSRGYQVADWYEAMAAALPRIHEELEDMIARGRVGAYIDLEALMQSLDAWPPGNWAHRAVIDTYRVKLLHGLALGMFIRQVEGEPC